MYFGFKDISISYGKREILNNVTLEFNEGKIYSIIGQNGCGKTSLLKLISKVVKQTSGDVYLNDVSLKGIKSKEIAKTIAYVSQYHPDLADIDVRTLISYGRYPYKKFGQGNTAEDREIIDRAIQLTNLEKLQDSSVSTLSGGERQRAWIAMALAQQPKILILDEPTTYLDISYQIEVLDLISELNKELGITIIMVLHDLNLASRYSDFLYALKDKKVFAYGTPEEVITFDNLNEVFNIESKITVDEISGKPYFYPLKTRRKL